MTAALIAAFLIWRLRRANQTLTTILREERERPVDFDVDDRTPHHLGKDGRT
ncbi:hypothetical protein [Actinokineospora xionganensis]|uniref:Uncharacterized protein n=1 Tax=Actinokineospora xionganensis TaxID=2684470 RepID=A0ABR7L315_9PSEU|nr:hypothetical protein [Actinokineospora xionganensis]MBC6446898.1 hypothetical protein [Actinokineospora xionganensis]